jgi:hypothetical protein
VGVDHPATTNKNRSSSHGVPLSLFLRRWVGFGFKSIIHIYIHSLSMSAHIIGRFRSPITLQVGVMVVCTGSTVVR